MAIPLPYVGEGLIACMINEMRLEFLSACHLLEECDRGFIQSSNMSIAYTDVKLMPYGGKAFDGASRVDIVVLLNPSLGVPFEIKLGATRLSKSRVDKEWLSDCGLSHQGRRHTGNMMAILERKLSNYSTDDSLHAQISGRAVKLTDHWFIITRSRVLAAWKGKSRPSFSPNVRLCSLEEIVRRFGGREPFNCMVRKTLDFDYYSEWVLGGGTDEVAD